MGEGGYNKMIPFRKQKFENAVAYFAFEFNRRKGYYPRQTWIYKFLALLDFRSLKKTGVPCIGLEYDAMKFGPVPNILYNSRSCLRFKKFKFIKTADGGFRVEPVGKPNLDYFADDEIDLMEEILDDYTRDGVNLDNLIANAHKEIKAWNKAWDIAIKYGRGRMPMRYEDEFDDLSKKSENELTPEEEYFLVYKSMKDTEEAKKAIS